MFPSHLLTAAEKLLAELRHRNLRLVTAESCTGGAIAAVVTEIAGSSDVFERGYVTYSNAAKTTDLAVDEKLILADGAVSDSVAKAMALGAIDASGAELSVAVTGIAGPGGGTETKPVGLVYIATADADGTVLSERKLFGDIGRSDVREKTVEAAIALLHRHLQQP